MITEKIKIISDVGDAISGFHKVEKASQGMSSKLQSIGGGMASLGAKSALFTAPLAAGLGLMTNKAVEFDTAISGASRALDLSTKEVKLFGDQAKRIAPAIGLSPTKFAELATEAGKLGVAKEAIIGFTKEVGEISAITDLTAAQTQDLAASFAALQTITGVTGKELSIYGATVNKLDDAIGGTTPNIIEFTRQTAASGKLLNLGIKDLAAYGSTMQALGIQSGVAFRSFNSLLTKLAAPQTLSKKGIEGLDALGLSAQEMADIMTTDANAGIELFLTRIREVSEVDVSKALGAVKQVVGGDYGDEILTLALSHEKLGQALGYASDEMDQANLAKKQDELAKKLGNVKGQQAILAAQWERLSITIGSAVLPSITDLLGALTPLVDKFAAFAENNPKLLKAGLAIAAIAISASPVLIVLGGVISAIGTISSSLAVLTPVLGGIKAAFLGIGSAVSVATPIIGTIGGVLAGISAPVWLTIGAFVALGAAIGVVAANWDQVSGFLSRSWQAFASNWMGGIRILGIYTNQVWESMTGYMAQKWNASVNFLLNTIPSFASRMWQAGQSLVYNFFSGINSYFQKGIEFFKSQLAYLRGLLPGSEPKFRSPLSNLSEAGAATMSNFSQGFNSPVAATAMGGALRGVRSGLTAGNTTTNNTSSSVTVIDNRRININGGEQGGNLIDILRKSDRELIDMIDKARDKTGRGTR